MKSHCLLITKSSLSIGITDCLNSIPSQTLNIRFNWVDTIKAIMAHRPPRAHRLQLGNYCLKSSYIKINELGSPHIHCTVLSKPQLTETTAGLQMLIHLAGFLPFPVVLNGFFSLLELQGHQPSYGADQGIFQLWKNWTRFLMLHPFAAFSE